MFFCQICQCWSWSFGELIFQSEDSQELLVLIVLFWRNCFGIFQNSEPSTKEQITICERNAWSRLTDRQFNSWFREQTILVLALNAQRRTKQLFDATYVTRDAPCHRQGVRNQWMSCSCSYYFQLCHLICETIFGFPGLGCFQGFSHHSKESLAMTADELTQSSTNCWLSYFAHIFRAHQNPVVAQW